MTRCIPSARPVRAALPALGVLLWLTTAQAAPPEAVARQELAKKLFRAGHFLEAGKAFEQTYDLYPGRGALFNAARAYAKGGHDELALAAYVRFTTVSEAQGKSQGANVRRARKAITRLRKRLLRTRTPLMVRVVPDDAVVRIDGLRIPAGREHWLEPGVHEMEVSRPNYATVTRRLDLLVGVASTHSVTLDRLASTGVLEVTSSPTAARVQIDGAYVGQTPIVARRPPGTVMVRVARPGHDTVERSADVVAGSKTRLEVHLAATSSPAAPTVADETPLVKQWWFWTTIGVVVAGGATAAVLLTQDPGTTRAPPAEFGLWAPGQ